MTRVPREKMAKRTIFLEWISVRETFGERKVVTDLLSGSCALINSGIGRERISKSDVILNTASVIRWL